MLSSSPHYHLIMEGPRAHYQRSRRQLPSTVVLSQHIPLMCFTTGNYEHTRKHTHYTLMQDDL